MRCVASVLGVSIATVWTVAATAQNPQFKSGTAAVRVDALVTDGRRPVRGLTAASFELRDNGVRQTITDVHHETLPLNVICALDVSSSVAGEPLEDLKRGYLALIDALSKEDRAALLTFANRIALHSALTGDRARLQALVGQLATGGTTSLFDALFSALALRETDEGRTLLILLSDGRDTSSWLTARKLVDAARRTDVVVYPVTTQTADAASQFQESVESRDSSRVLGGKSLPSASSRHSPMKPVAASFMRPTRRRSARHS